MDENLQQKFDKSMNKKSRLKRKTKELLTLLDKFAANSNPDYSCLCEIAADLTDVYGKLRDIELEKINSWIVQWKEAFYTRY